MATPKFLQRLYAEGEKRRQLGREKEHAKKVCTTLEAGDRQTEVGRCAEVALPRDAVAHPESIEDDGCIEGRCDDVPPPLSYSSSSTTSSGPSIDGLDDCWPTYNSDPMPDGLGPKKALETSPAPLCMQPSPPLADAPSVALDRVASNAAVPRAFEPAQIPSSSSSTSTQYPYSYAYASSSTYSSPASTFSYTSASSYASSSSFASLQPLVLPPASLDLLPASSSSSSLTPTVGPPTDDLSPSPESVVEATTSEVRDSSESTETGLEEDDQLFQPPDNFAMVAADVYRSSFPKKQNFPFLRSLGLRTVLTLVGDDYPEDNRQFVEAEGITFIQIGIPGNKEPFVSIPDERIRKALSIVLDTRNHPLMIHCNKGKHRTGCLVGCLRKMQAWSSTSIFEEYRKFSFPKSRAMDQLFIELFQPDWKVIDHAYLPEWCQGEEAEALHRSRSLAQQKEYAQRKLDVR